MNDKKIVRVEGGESDGIARRRNELVTAKMFRLSLQAHRLFLYVLSHVRNEHDEDTEFEFSIYQLAKDIGIDRAHLYASMVGVLDELARVMVELPVLDAAGKLVPDRVVRVGLIKNRQQLRLGEGGEKRVDGSISVSIYKELLPYVRQLQERYSEVELKYIFRLTSSYSQKLYDLLKVRAFTGRPWRVAREDLYELLAIEAGKFEGFADFRRYVLERAQEEINNTTDIAFDFELIRTGKTVTEFVFRLRKEGGGQVEVLPGTAKHQAFKSMLALGLSSGEAERMLAKWWETDPEKLVWHAAEAKRQGAVGKVRNVLGWFRSGMKGDYRPNRTLFSGLKAKAEKQRAQYREKVGPIDPALAAGLDDLAERMSA